MFTPASHQVPALSEPGLRMSTVSNYSGQAKRLQTMVSSLFGPGLSAAEFCSTDSYQTCRIETQL